jgi:hypothetical protein
MRQDIFIRRSEVQKESLDLEEGPFKIRMVQPSACSVLLRSTVPTLRYHKTSNQ